MTNKLGAAYFDTEPGPMQLVCPHLSGWVYATYGAGALTKIILTNEPDSAVPEIRTKTFSPKENAVSIVANPPLPSIELK